MQYDSLSLSGLIHVINFLPVFIQLNRRILFVCFLSVLILSCSRYENADFGLYPKYIRGKVTPEIKKEDNPLLVIVIEKNQTFMEFKEKGTIYSQNIKVLKGFENGAYIYNWGATAESVVIFFYLRNRYPKQYAFKAGIGIGGFEYNPELPTAKNWEDTYSLDIKPQLTGLINKADSQLPGIDQGIISDWMKNVEKNFKR